MDTKTITVLWMDDREETYPRASTVVREGVLHIHQYAEITHTLTGEWHLPIANIRCWYPDGQGGPGE